MEGVLWLVQRPRKKRDDGLDCGRRGVFLRDQVIPALPSRSDISFSRKEEVEEQRVERNPLIHEAGNDVVEPAGVPRKGGRGDSEPRRFEAAFIHFSLRYESVEATCGRA